MNKPQQVNLQVLGSCLGAPPACTTAASPRHQLPTSPRPCPNTPHLPAPWGTQAEHSLQLPGYLQEENCGARGITFRRREGWEAPAPLPPRAAATQAVEERSREVYWHPHSHGSC